MVPLRNMLFKIIDLFHSIFPKLVYVRTFSIPGKFSFKYIQDALRHQDIFIMRSVKHRKLSFFWQNQIMPPQIIML
jgi:hypothetical protein